jgi:DNA-binding NarL/FixJ family response regulator
MIGDSDLNPAAPGVSAIPAPIRVYLLMESRLAREGLARVLRKVHDVLVAGEAGQPEAAKQDIHDSKCHVLVMDTFDPHWISDCLQSESSPRPDFKTLLIGMDNDAEQFLLAARSEVTGYLLKDASAADILLAIRALVHGGAHCPPQLCLRLFQYVAQQDTTVPADPKPACPNITLRQEKLVNLVAKGLTNKEIAFQLGLSEFTVKNHMQRIMRRLKVANRREVVDTVRIRERQFLQPGLGRKALSESTIGATR